jgi:hypothetical protein
VHPNATYQDFSSGVSHLKRAIDSRSEAIRVLVEENFDRFVAVKAATDGQSYVLTATSKCLLYVIKDCTLRCGRVCWQTLLTMLLGHCANT